MGCVLFVVFFLQAEVDVRFWAVTGVGRCPLPIPFLARRRRKLEPGPRRPVVEHPPQDNLVIGDIAVARRTRVFVCFVRHEPTLAIAALSRATVNGATERILKPVASSAVVRRVSAAASPHSETSTPRLRAASTVPAISASTAGWLASLRSATPPLSRAAAIVYWVRSFEPT